MLQKDNKYKYKYKINKYKSIKSMKLRSGKKTRKVMKGGNIHKNSVSAFSNNISEESSDMSDDTHSSVRRNTIASNVNKSILRNRHNMSVKKNVIILSKPVVTVKKNETKQSNYYIWLEMADKEYTTLQNAKKYRKIVSYCGDNDEELEKKYNKETSSLACQEQYWTNHNLMFLVDFMGDLKLWEYLNIKVTEGRPILNAYDISNAFYSGSHWYGRKAHDKKSFDPYDGFQIRGSNQFCQTYAMMYIYDKLPEKIMDKEKKFTKYYEYTKKALDFIKYIIDSHFDGWVKFSNIKKIEVIDKKISMTEYKEQLYKALNECIAHPNICLNVIIDTNFTTDDLTEHSNVI